jgi:hypothetical protein
MRPRPRKGQRFDPPQIAREGRRVYEHHRMALERHHRRQYVLIDIPTEKIFIADSPEAAYRQAEAEKKEGPFYLVRVGERAAFRSRRLSNGDTARITR